MYILNSHINIGAYEFDFVSETQIESSWKEQTVKGSITLPAALRFDKGKLKTSIKKGDAVTIKIGYGDDLNTVFEGFVSRVKPSVPVIIEVEDAMWKLKQIEINDTAKNETVKSFLERNLPDYEIDCFDIELPRFVASKITAAKLLDQLKSDYGLYSFFRNGKLVVGKQYDPENYEVQIAKFGYNILDNSLEYTAKEDVKIKVTAVSNMASGEKIEIQLGDADGEDRTLNFYNLPKADLQKVAQKEMERLMYDGYRGDLTMFGDPFVRTGDVLELQDDEDTDKTGRYWIDGVTYSFGTSGFRQSIKLGART